MVLVNNQIVNPEAPPALTGLKLSRPDITAAGVTAIMVSLKHVLAETSLRRALKGLGMMNQKTGFDCPSCAWPDPDDERSSLGEYCENGVKAFAEEATLRKIDQSFFQKHSLHSLAAMPDYELGKLGRLAQPMYLARGTEHYQPITWAAAFEKISITLHSLDSPDEAVFYTSGRTSNEAAFLWQLFARQFGTNNLPDCSNMCHESSGVALSESLGIGKGSVTLDDFYHAEVIVILGQNPGTNHPRMLTALQKAKEKGAHIIAINPLPEAGLLGFVNPQTIKGLLGVSTQLADLFLQVTINGDMPLLQAIEKILVEKAEIDQDILDRHFIEKNTEGFKAFKAHLNSLNIEELARDSGVDLPQIIEAAELLRSKKKIIACWAMGLTQHKNAVDTIKEIVNLLLLKGSIGKKGAGTCPVRGHSNVQGDRTMGIYEKPSANFLKKLKANFHFTPPQHHGYDVVDSIKAMNEGRIRVFMAMGGNFLSATPDTHYTAAGLRKCELTVQVSTKLNRSHLITGREALILPTFGRSDQDRLNGEVQFLSCENSMGVVHQSKGVLQPVSDLLLSEPVIVCKMAQSVFNNHSGVSWKKYELHYDHIRNEIERTIPGFENYNERIRVPGGFYLPNVNREGNFATETGKAVFNVASFKPIELDTGELMMMTIRSHDQFNTTIYGLNDRYRGIARERRIVLMNTADMRELGYEPNEAVNLVNNTNGVERIAENFLIVPYSIPRKCVATYFPETNVLVPITSVADKSNTPVSKQVRITLRKRNVRSI